MIHNFDNYIKESIKDKLTGKELTGKTKILYDCVNELRNFGINTTEIKYYNGKEKSFYYSYLRKNGVYLLMTITDDEIIKWKIFDQTKGSSNETIILESDNWSEVLDTIIKKVYKDVDINILTELSEQSIKDSKQKIIEEEEKIIKEEHYIKSYENVKKYLNINN